MCKKSFLYFSSLISKCKENPNIRCCPLSSHQKIENIKKFSDLDPLLYFSSMAQNLSSPYMSLRVFLTKLHPFCRGGSITHQCVSVSLLFVQKKLHCYIHNMHVYIPLTTLFRQGVGGMKKSQICDR